MANDKDDDYDKTTYVLKNHNNQPAAEIVGKDNNKEEEKYDEDEVMFASTLRTR